MTIEHNAQSPGCSVKGKLAICLGLALLCLLGLTFCAWSLGSPTMALRSIPVFPGADIQIDERYFGFSDNGPPSELMYHVDRPWPEVVDFYRDEMGKRGWKLEKEYSMEVEGATASKHYAIVCMLFRRTPAFVASVESSGVVENGTVLANTTVTVHTTLSNCKKIT